jgi:hypothetical protein
MVGASMNRPELFKPSTYPAKSCLSLLHIASMTRRDRIFVTGENAGLSCLKQGYGISGRAG